MRRRITLIVLLGTFIGLTIWITNMEKIKFMPPFTYVEILEETWTHLKMVGISELISIGIGVPLGILITRPKLRKLAPVVVGAANVGQSIPSLAVLALMAPIFVALGLTGFGFGPAIVALAIYALMPVLRNSYAGINDIDPAIIESAKGMGMSRMQIARKIELPLARPVIMAGIRTSTVINVGTATLAALIGASGLGLIILSGLLNGVYLVTLQGAAPTAALAVILDTILGGIENWLTPRGLQVREQ